MTAVIFASVAAIWLVGIGSYWLIQVAKSPGKLY